MIITISKDNGIIQNAWFENKELTFHLFINTVERWKLYDEVRSGFFFKTWWYSSPNNSNLMDAVTLRAENKSDVSILDRFTFEQQNKDQLWVLFPDETII